jgi:pseudouridine kinase
MGAHSFVVVGGNNVDINATAATALVYGDSNPGGIHTGLGGVGRNIAENLTRLGQQVSLITAFGDDEYASLAIRQAERLGMDLSHAIRAEHAASCVYVCINEPNGEMAVAVNDMALCERITPAYLAERLPVLNAADAIIVDANIPEESIDFIVQRCTPPIIADAVAAKKAARLHRSLPHLHALKANQIEIELLTGTTVTHEYDLHAAARTLHQMGVDTVLITLGSRGAFISEGGAQFFDRPVPQRVVNTTGCGDAFTAAAALAMVEQRSAREVLGMGLAGAAICAMSKHAVSDQMSYALLSETLRVALQQEAKP